MGKKYYTQFDSFGWVIFGKDRIKLIKEIFFTVYYMRLPMVLTTLRSTDFFHYRKHINCKI